CPRRRSGPRSSGCSAPRTASTSAMSRPPTACRTRSSATSASCRGRSRGTGCGSSRCAPTASGTRRSTRRCATRCARRSGDSAREALPPPVEDGCSSGRIPGAPELVRLWDGTARAARQNGRGPPAVEEERMHVDEWLQASPATGVYVLVGVIIALESLGIPLPGEIMLVSAALLSSQGVVSPVLVGVYASAGAIVGDSIGYFIGYKGGAPLFDRLGRRFPRHFGPEQIAKAERLFHRYGVG